MFFVWLKVFADVLFHSFADILAACFEVFAGVLFHSSVDMLVACFEVFADDVLQSHFVWFGGYVLVGFVIYLLAAVRIDCVGVHAVLLSLRAPLLGIPPQRDSKYVEIPDYLP